MNFKYICFVFFLVPLALFCSKKNFDGPTFPKEIFLLFLSFEKCAAIRDETSRHFFSTTKFFNKEREELNKKNITTICTYELHNEFNHLSCFKKLFAIYHEIQKYMRGGQFEKKIGSIYKEIFPTLFLMHDLHGGETENEMKPYSKIFDLFFTFNQKTIKSADNNDQQTLDLKIYTNKETTESVIFYRTNDKKLPDENFINCLINENRENKTIKIKRYDTRHQIFINEPLYKITPTIFTYNFIIDNISSNGSNSLIYLIEKSEFKKAIHLIRNIRIMPYINPQKLKLILEKIYKSPLPISEDQKKLLQLIMKKGIALEYQYIQSELINQLCFLHYFSCCGNDDQQSENSRNNVFTILELLLLHGLNPNKREVRENNNTLLHSLCSDNVKSRIINLFLKYGANPFIVNSNNETALSLAMKDTIKNKDIIDIFRKKIGDKIDDIPKK